MKSGHKDGSVREDRDVKETKGKAKAKSKSRAKTQRKSKESVDDEIDLPKIKGSTSKVKCPLTRIKRGESCRLVA